MNEGQFIDKSNSEKRQYLQMLTIQCVKMLGEKDGGNYNLELINGIVDNLAVAYSRGEYTKLLKNTKEYLTLGKLKKMTFVPFVYSLLLLTGFLNKGSYNGNLHLPSGEKMPIVVLYSQDDSTILHEIRHFADDLIGIVTNKEMLFAGQASSRMNLSTIIAASAFVGMLIAQNSLVDYPNKEIVVNGMLFVSEISGLLAVINLGRYANSKVERRVR